MQVSVCLIAVFITVVQVEISKSDPSTGEAVVNGSATSTKGYNSVTTNRDRSLTKEILLKQDMSQA